MYGDRLPMGHGGPAPEIPLHGLDGGAESQFFLPELDVERRLKKKLLASGFGSAGPMGHHHMQQPHYGHPQPHHGHPAAAAGPNAGTWMAGDGSIYPDHPHDEHMGRYGGGERGPGKKKTLKNKMGRFYF